MKPKKQFLLIKSVKLLTKDYGRAGLMVLFDALFLVSLLGMQVLSKYFAGFLIVPTHFASIMMYVFLTLAYLLIILFAYSFFKYGVLDSIRALSGKSEFSLGRLAQFYLLNIILCSIFLALMLLLDIALFGIKQDYIPYMFIVLAAPYLLLLYVVANLAHSIFYGGSSVKKSVMESFRIAFTRIKDYREILLMIVFGAVILGIFLFASGYLIRLVSSKNYGLYLKMYSYFRQSSIILFDLLLYLAILVNRVSFYQVTKNVLPQHKPGAA